MLTIQNQFLEVGVHEKGAELASIRSVRTGLEYMWEADPAHWGRHSCILFPVIGATHGGVIRVEGREYPMKKHGIVRDAPFELVEFTDTSMTFSIQSDEETKKMFPFDFELRASYVLEGSTCHVDYEVYNDGESIMPFSIGAHPAFNCPLYGDKDRSDYKLSFDKLERQSSPLISDSGLISNERFPILSEDSLIEITNELFDRDALILQDFNSSEVSIVDDEGKAAITVTINGFTHLGIWSKGRESPFVCIEPWYGIADPQGYSGEFYDKPGIQQIAPDEVFSCRHSIKIEKP